MKSYLVLVFCFLGFLHITAAGAIILRKEIPALTVGADTIKVTREGVHNSILLNTRIVSDSLVSIPQINVKGDVVQKGDSNWISINIKEIESCTRCSDEIPDSMIPDITYSTNDFSIVNTGRHNIEIKQEGSNNRIKIESK